jgi:hypothetical protein
MRRENESELSARDLKLRWKHFREDALRDWLATATEEEKLRLTCWLRSTLVKDVTDAALRYSDVR